MKMVVLIITGFFFLGTEFSSFAEVSIQVSKKIEKTCKEKNKNDYGASPLVGRIAEIAEKKLSECIAELKKSSVDIQNLHLDQDIKRVMRKADLALERKE